MKKRNSLKVVIDASVARASGTSVAPDSTNCRQFLEHFMTSDNKLIMTKEISREWSKHQSKFAYTWRSRMVGKKKVEFIKDIENEKIRGGLEVCSILSETKKSAVIKDLHLVEAAVQTDNLIVSNDDKMRANTVVLAHSCSEIHDIMWVNPTNENEKAIDWLIGGCYKEEFRTIGFLSNNEAASS